MLLGSAGHARRLTSRSPGGGVSGSPQMRTWGWRRPPPRSVGCGAGSGDTHLSVKDSWLWGTKSSRLPHHFPALSLSLKKDRPCLCPVGICHLSGWMGEGAGKPSHLPGGGFVPASHRPGSTTWSGTGLLDSSLPCGPRPSPQAWPVPGEGRGGAWAFPSSLPRRLETGSLSQARPLLSGRQCAHTVRALCGTQTPSPLT